MARISAETRARNEKAVRAAMDWLLKGDLPPGGSCDLKTLATEAGVTRTAFYPKKNRDGTTRPGPYQHLGEEFERRLRTLQEAGEVVDPRIEQIERLKTKVSELKERLVLSCRSCRISPRLPQTPPPDFVWEVPPGRCPQMRCIARHRIAAHTWPYSRDSVTQRGGTSQPPGWGSAVAGGTSRTESGGVVGPARSAGQGLAQRDETVAELTTFEELAVSRLAAQHDEIVRPREQAAALSNVRRLPAARPGTAPYGSCS
ncbi:hypothetical protein [Streptomyces johnsoniae]|uniref:Uncharacterized protein n=1 Tax=Streptomyces johnsoniae TaxID=3075532 RepID=A0ABU2SCD3_9ACTN|nr:hypothetical protein [Streptomyces sp. DSM 41886]MDT0446557.1 hypothetical protein [Streptomyces sp. DSM 41886]